MSYKPEYLKKKRCTVRITAWVLEEMKRKKMQQGPEFEQAVIEKFGLKNPHTRIDNIEK